MQRWQRMDENHMTLTWFEKLPNTDAYRVNGHFAPYAVLAREVRFIDAELSAEFHNQHMEAVKAHDRAYPYGESAELDIAEERIAVLERFATHPHFDQNQST